MGRKLKGNNALCIYQQSWLHLFTNSGWLCNVFIWKKRFLRKECTVHSIVWISVLMIVNKIVFVVHWCYWLFSHVLKSDWIYCSLNECPIKRIFFSCSWIHIARKWKLLWRIRISQDVNESLATLLNVYNYADILIEDVFRAIECRLAQMNVFLHYCLTFSVNDCVFSLNENNTKGVLNIQNLITNRSAQSWLCKFLFY